MKSLAAVARFLQSKIIDSSWENLSIRHICLDNRQLQKGSLFCACAGIYEDGRNFINQAISAGAVAIAYEDDGKFVPPQVADIPFIAVEQLNEKIFALGPYFYNDPSKALTVIGVTGTNGKTSTTHYIAQILTALGQKCGVIGTVGNGLWGALNTTNCTTPDPLHLQYLLAQLRDQGATTVAMEVSSHGLVQRRVEGIKFDVAVFTNLTQDHLDYHGDMEHYAQAKAMLFSMPSIRFAVLNADDPYSKLMQNSCGTNAQVLWYSNSSQSSAQLRVLSSTMQTNGIELKLASVWGEAEVNLPLLGAFNVSNILAVICCLSALNHPFSAILMALEKVKPVSGRMEKISYPGYATVVIDYAHTPDALEKALIAVREHCQANIWVVFGCGGNRDRGKRPIMAKIAEQFADKVVMTQDNTRLEDERQIFADIVSGFKAPEKVYIEPDRAKAIAYALQNAAAGDCILLAGKGHETYMDTAGNKTHFDEREVIKNFIKGGKP
ncbi:MAG: UDP-N-acetylmuramoyl-L-alanyl-D-glutamate--2,6-diaminopimelate ligase [Gammaproteobacteria bacterium]|jgi:UDP-N-acetylmuramoyl-L-alanyl-D-glutamate--2,6-diaminopimelate ligase|nr:UDP-N-acetylmuramoyl-L-alanyl-D-glutamate--2,6-diaminopimelate ligase [Gammaproteobacteria bacterium]